MCVVCGVLFVVLQKVNNILPGGLPQDPHRDYHMGFQQDDIINFFPTHMQIASQFLTLQGLIAHTDMPRESGMGEWREEERRKQKRKKKERKARKLGIC